MKTLSISTALLLLLTVAACDTVDDNHDDHAEAAGARLVMNGETVYQVLRGEVSCASAPCGIDVSVGEETPLITVEFLDEDGDEIHDEDLDEEYVLGHQIGDASVAEFERHDEDGRFSFHVHGESAGATVMMLELLHGDHADFTTPPLADARAIAIRVGE